jgi:hypothetical protein
MPMKSYNFLYMYVFIVFFYNLMPNVCYQDLERELWIEDRL